MNGQNSTKTSERSNTASITSPNDDSRLKEDVKCSIYNEKIICNRDLDFE